MKKIDINISTARIESYSVDLEGDLPNVTATIGLYAGEKKVSTFSLTTRSYLQGLQFDLPASIIMPIKEVAERLETILTLECSRSMGELEAHEAEVVE